MRDVEGLRSYLNKRVRLFFTDGEIVEAILLGVDPERDRDLTYEVGQIVLRGSPPARGTTEGATCIAPLQDLESWEAVAAG
jgi:hypothetical protein